MPLEALLLSHDPEVLKILRRVLNDLQIRAEVCTGPEPAAEWLERKKCDVVVVDIDDMPGAAAVVSEMRQSSANRNTLTFALLNGATTPRQAFEIGANLTLQKPLSLDTAMSSFRAAHTLVLSERRRYYRYAVEMPVTVLLEGKEIEATASNVSVGGMAAHVPPGVPVKALVQVRFKLPGGKAWIGTGAIAAWADEEGHTGFRFEKMPASARQEFERWESEQAKEGAPAS